MKKTDIKVFSRKFLFRIMKIYTILFFVTMAKLFAAEAYGQNITLDLKNAELKAFFTEIENKTEYNFFYNNSLVDVTKKVSLEVKNQNLKEVLNQLLKNTQIDFRFVKNQIVLFPKNNTSISELIEEIIKNNEEENSSIVSSEEIIKSKINVVIQNLISGTVSDASGPLPGVSILIKGTKKGTQTNFDGQYQIAANKGDVLVFSYVGMKTTSATVADSNTINVVMQEDANVLDEVVVVAYGTSSKEAITGSVSKINTADIEKRTISNITSALEGSTAGVIVTAPSGQPGSGQDVRIRGFSSFSSSNAALYVVDGIPINGNINGINPADIESVTILKDAGSTALYGNKAANGVVLVTTKSGKSKTGSLVLNTSTSVVSRGTKEYNRLGPADFYEAYWEARRNAVIVPVEGVDQVALAAANLAASNGIFSNLIVNPFNVPNNQIVGVDGKINPSATLLYPDDLDWEGAISRTGIRKNVDLSFDNKTDNGGYFASLGYLNEEGYILNSDYNRVTARVNGNIQAKPWLKAGVNLSGAISKGNQAQAGSTQSTSTVNPFRFTRDMGSIYPIYEHDPVTGAFILDGNGDKIEALLRGSGSSSGRHIVYEVANDIDIDEYNRLDGKTFIEVELVKGLKFTNNMSYELQSFYNTRYRNPFIGDGAPNADATRLFTRNATQLYNQLLNYKTTINSRHNVDLLAGHENQKWVRTFLYGSVANEIFSGNIELLNFSEFDTPESAVDEVTDESYFGRLNYDFDNKYYLSASVRTDGSSKFSKENRWGTFYSLGGSWSIDKEDFIADVDWIDVLKLRASQGELGNSNFGSDYYPSLPLLALGYNNGAEPGVLLSSLGSPDLKWEKSVHTDVAIEFGFFNRLRGSLEYFNKVSKDLIFNVPLPLSAGGLIFTNPDAIKQNIGELFNRGFEISLSYDILKQQDLGWTMTLNASTLRNEITKLPEGQEVISNGTKQLKVGKGLYDYYIRDWYGVDPADGSGLYVAKDITASDVRTINGVVVTPSYSNAKEEYMGSVIPDVYGSVNSNFRYKNFNLGFLLTYQIGGKNLDNGYANLMGIRTYGAALHEDILKRWRKPGDITDVPRADVTSSYEWDNTSDRFLVDASFLSVRQINVSYSFSEELLKKIGMAEAKLYANAENVLNFNARKGFTQQQEFSGNTSNVYIAPKIFTVGLNVKF